MNDLGDVIDQIGDIGCLGCLIAARDRGVVSEAEYAEVSAMWDESNHINHQPTAPCPRCGATAYISLYDPDLMRCGSCTLWSVKGAADEWIPYIEYKISFGAPAPEPVEREEELSHDECRPTPTQP